MFIYLFIGYPKCGSSDIYENFLKKNDHINDLTKSLDENNFFNFIINNNDKEFKQNIDYFKKIIDNNKKNNKLNFFTSNKFLESVYYNCKNSIEKIFNRIKFFFELSELEVKIFYIVRDHHEIILSSYVEFYDQIIFNDKNYSKFDFYIKKMFIDNDSIYLRNIKKIYKYDKFYNLLSSTFSNDNIKYYNFAIIKNNKTLMYKKISLFLNIPFDKKFNFTSPINISEKTKDGSYLLNKHYVVKIITNNIVYRFLIRRIISYKIRKVVKKLILKTFDKRININSDQIDIINKYYN
jgi:hypothetical protein